MDRAGSDGLSYQELLENVRTQIHRFISYYSKLHMHKNIGLCLDHDDWAILKQVAIIWFIKSIVRSTAWPARKLRHHNLGDTWVHPWVQTCDVITTRWSQEAVYRDSCQPEQDFGRRGCCAQILSPTLTLLKNWWYWLRNQILSPRHIIHPCNYWLKQKSGWMFPITGSLQGCWGWCIWVHTHILSMNKCKEIQAAENKSQDTLVQAIPHKINPSKW